MRALATLTLAAATAFVSLAASAQTAQPAQAPAVGTSERGPLPAVRTMNGVSYMNGGAGLENAAYIKSRGSEFPLHILFSGRGGEYGVAQSVTVRNGDREVLTLPNVGPYFMLQVPPGRYSIDATFKGAVEQRSVTVGTGISTVNWNTLRASE
ncbi:MAG: hypothetical protein ABI671_01200 [Burkholderiales bacterium]